MRTALTLMAGLTLLGTPARSGEPPRYGVEIKIEEGAQLIGAPIIFAPEGTPATVETELYRMTLTVTPYMRGGTQRLAIDSQLHLRREGRWKLAASPRFDIVEGASATMKIAPPASRDLPLTIAVAARRLTPLEIPAS